MAPTLSVIIATAGQRLSLGDTLAALVPQLAGDDEVLLLIDGPPMYGCGAAAPVIRHWLARSARVWHRHVPGGPHDDWGMTARNHALAERWPCGSHLLWIDDDDVTAPGALAAIRAALVLAPDVPHMFRVLVHAEANGGVIWWIPEVIEGNVSTQTIVTPNVPAMLGRFGNRYAGDFDFVRDTVALYGGQVVWDDHVIADIFPARDRHESLSDRA